MRKQIPILCSLVLVFFANAQNVNIPDTNFKNALLAHGGTITGTNISVIDTNGDGEISTSEASAYTGTISVSYKWVSDLTGVEAFTQLTGLICDNNQLTSLDVSANTQLTRLDCYSNQLTTLDLSANTQLTILFCLSNQLTSLDLSTNTQLTRLRCFDNQLTSLDLSANTQLTELICNNNQLMSLDVSANTQLTALICNNNQLTSLDISANTQLENLYCRNNQLTSLNVANGNNGSLWGMYAYNNPNLTCIQHDIGFNPTNAFYWQKDATASWGTNCPTLSTVDIDREEENVMIYPNPASDKVHVEWKEEGIEQVDILDASGRKVLSQKVTGKKATIAIGRLASGIYFVKTGNTTQKLMVE